MVEIARLPEALAAELREAGGLAAAGHLEAAVTAYQRLLARHPDVADAWYDLGLLQRRLRRFEAALASYAEALRRGVGRPEEVHLNRGVIFTNDLRQDAAAERELRAALVLNPDYVPALQNLANLHEDLGRREEALATYERLLALEPRAYEALARYAQLAGAERPAEGQIERLRRAIADPAASDAERASLGFVLAGLLDTVGAYPEAFAAAEAANRASRASTRPPAHYDRSVHEHLIDALIAAFPRPRQVRPPAVSGAAVLPAADTVRPRPIFICGMFRSGSTLAERLLAGHPEVRAGGELDLLPHLVQSALAPFPSRMATLTDATLAALAAGYLERLRQLFPGARYVTDKRPDNFLLVGLIKTLFPEARIVHTMRDALDTCLSIFFLHLDQSMSYALDLMDIGHYFRQYRRLMAHWSSLYGEDILHFSYDALVREPRPATQRLLTYCGLEWHEGCLDFTRHAGSVRTASVWQVREALYQRSSGRARHYARELSALAAVLAEA